MPESSGESRLSLQLVQESAEDLYEEAPFGYLSSQAIDGQILQINQTLCRWTGYRADEVTGVRRFGDLLSPAGRIVHATRHIPLLQTAGAADGIALELVRTDGSRLPVLMNSVVRHASDGTPLLTRTALFDATAYRRYEAQLIDARDRAERSEVETRRALAAAEAANLAKVRFFAAMNHEFRTPISIITGFADLLVEAAEQKRVVPTADWTRDIAHAAAHLLELLEDTTRYAQLDELKQRLDLHTASLHGAARAGLFRAAAMIERAQVTARLEEGDEVFATLDKELAAEAVSCSLRDFAYRAGPGAELRLRYFDAPARIEVSCSTLLLSEEMRASVGVPLDAPAVLHRGLQGAGVNITIAARIAVLHGGKLSLTLDERGGASLVLFFAAS
ncbi:histidine kinase dimerization/phospho-acceptor domain-containing protein [Roseomonas sp. KE2513]|uniref:PAS domain-containing sensor histidine kinase n=1 Tax=Roseomonas sp. KE2513 TaxID=2479202 RepID=UPI0018E0240B|nr:histidine kinase dimerization/phospho-acceptor domain-containing protein [Roseomonas sp. KE2513]